jgi:hypothetical protein
MSRELREAKAIESVVNPWARDTPRRPTSRSPSRVDFDGDNVREPRASDPEVLTYRFDAAGQRLVLEAVGSALPVSPRTWRASRSGSRAVATLRRHESGVRESCGSQTATKDGTIYWWELDGHSSRASGNCNGLLDTAELSGIDSVVIDLKVLYGAKQQQYQTRVDLRNATG